MPTNIAWTDETTAEEIENRMEDKYEVNNKSGCWEWTAAKNDSGHGRIRIDDVLRYAHRVSYRLHVGELGDGNQVNHKCDNPSCINPDHLYKGSQKDNVGDAIERGNFLETKPRGQDNPNTVLNEEQVREIRRLYETTDHTQRSLADEYGVGKGTIQHILERKSWAHIDDGGSE